jgi:hypothetical protein
VNGEADRIPISQGDERLVKTSYEVILQRTLGRIDDLRSRQVMR